MLLPNLFFGQLYAPNSFTPNADGVNDVFIVSALDIYSPVLKIYNRWGRVVHYSLNLAPWDGNDGNGYYCDSGIYAWTLHYEDDKGLNHTEQGHIIMIR